MLRLIFIFIMIYDFIIAFQRSYCKQEFCIYIDKTELSLWLAQTFRYSNDEKGIEDALKGHIRNLKDRIERIEKALEQ